MYPITPSSVSFLPFSSVTWNTAAAEEIVKGRTKTMVRVLTYKNINIISLITNIPSMNHLPSEET
jgi:hypothetical protein